MTQEQQTQINWMNRREIIALLAGAGIVCYDSESTKELREALYANVQDGTIELPESK